MDDKLEAMLSAILHLVRCKRCSNLSGPTKYNEYHCNKLKKDVSPHFGCVRFEFNESQDFSFSVDNGGFSIEGDGM